jgi:hypothetical protein
MYMYIENLIKTSVIIQSNGYMLEI